MMSPQPGDRPAPDGSKSRAILAVLEQREQTIREVSNQLRKPFTQVWGLVAWLRKQQKVEVKYWRTVRIVRRGQIMPIRCRVAIYGVKA